MPHQALPTQTKNILLRYRYLNEVNNISFQDLYVQDEIPVSKPTSKTSSIPVIHKLRPPKRAIQAREPYVEMKRAETEKEIALNQQTEKALQAATKLDEPEIQRSLFGKIRKIISVS